MFKHLSSNVCLCNSFCSAFFDELDRKSKNPAWFLCLLMNCRDRSVLQRNGGLFILCQCSLEWRKYSLGHFYSPKHCHIYLLTQRHQNLFFPVWIRCIECMCVLKHTLKSHCYWIYLFHVDIYYIIGYIVWYKFIMMA